MKAFRLRQGVMTENFTKPKFCCLHALDRGKGNYKMSEQTKCPECGGIVVPVLPDPPKEPRACLRCQACGKEFEWLEAEYTERWQDG